VVEAEQADRDRADAPGHRQPHRPQGRELQGQPVLVVGRLAPLDDPGKGPPAVARRELRKDHPADHHRGDDERRTLQPELLGLGGLEEDRDQESDREEGDQRAGAVDDPAEAEDAARDRAQLARGGIDRRVDPRLPAD
jgi:hypothetical protein